MSACEEPGAPLPTPPREVAAGAAADSPTAEPMLECWRCGQRHAAALPKCPHCLATNRLLATPASPGTPAARWCADHQTEDRLIQLVWLLGAFMATSILAAVARVAGDIDPDQWSGVVIVLVAEGVDTLIVLYGLAKISIPRLPETAGRRRLLAWLSAAPLLGLMLAINVGYHRLLRIGLNLPDWIFETGDGSVPLVWQILDTWLQPAIVEELFFRYLAIGLLCAAVRPPTALVVSAVMFGMAHSGVPLSIPYLFVMGLVLGQLYYWSRNLALPMLFHLAHNAAVTWGEWS